MPCSFCFTFPRCCLVQSQTTVVVVLRGRLARLEMDKDEWKVDCVYLTALAILLEFSLITGAKVCFCLNVSSCIARVLR